MKRLSVNSKSATIASVMGGTSTASTTVISDARPANIKSKGLNIMEVAEANAINADFHLVLNEKPIDDLDLVLENGHVLFRTLDVDDWLQALQDQRETGLISPRDTYDP